MASSAAHPTSPETTNENADTMNPAQKRAFESLLADLQPSKKKYPIPFICPFSKANSSE